MTITFLITDMTSKQWTALGTVVTIIGIVISIIIWNTSDSVSIQTADSNVAIGNKAPVTQNLNVNKLDLPKPKIDLMSFEINMPNPNPELGFDSVYILSIVSAYTIANFLLEIKLPSSVDSMWMVKGWEAYAREGEYSPVEYRDGYAVFNIPNASGEYHLIFSNLKPEQLSLEDIKW